LHAAIPNLERTGLTQSRKGAEFLVFFFVKIVRKADWRNAQAKFSKILCGFAPWR
jgi:hypothetical protein